MTRAERNRLVRLMDGLIERRARRYQRQFQRELRRQANKIGQSLQSVGAEMTIANLPVIVEDARIEKILGDLYTETAIEFRRIVARQMLNERQKYRKQMKLYADQVDFMQLIQSDPELFEIYRSVLNYMSQNGARKVRSINEFTREEAERIIRKVINEGQMRGLGEGDIARELNRQVPQQMQRQAVFRAQRIARTETHGAANWSSLEEAKPLADSLVKVWGSFVDADTRQTHIEADGQTRELEEPFDVGGFALMTPADPDAPMDAAGEVINCRCTVLYERKEN